MDQQGHLCAGAALGLLLIGCGKDTADSSDTPAGGEATYTYHRDARAVLEAKCTSCHQDGNIAPFPLTTYEEAAMLAAAIQVAVESGSMPPWQGADGCNTYTNDFSLTDAEREILLGWIADGTPEGDPADAPAPQSAQVFEADLVLPLPEPYTPQLAPDDYRCQIIPWPLEETAWITGLNIEPDQEAIVHHVILFAASATAAEDYRALDAAEEGPGYTCFGGPNGSRGGGLSELTQEELLALLASGGTSELAGRQRWLGAWVPGTTPAPFPEGTGLRMEPGDILIAQLHYNTLSADAAPDQSSVALQVASSVSREAMILPFTDLGWVTGLSLLGEPMDIPAGEPDVVHETSSAGDGLMPSAARRTLGLEEDAPLVIHQVGHHMHQLGRTGYQSVHHADSGEETCLVDIPDWDFSWQGTFGLASPVVLRPEDELYLRCSWDNSPENQPWVDGAQVSPSDVTWGEGSLDEMCLSTLYITGE